MEITKKTMNRVVEQIKYETLHYYDIEKNKSDDQFKSNKIKQDVKSEEFQDKRLKKYSLILKNKLAFGVFKQINQFNIDGLSDEELDCFIEGCKTSEECSYNLLNILVNNIDKQI